MNNILFALIVLLMPFAGFTQSLSDSEIQELLKVKIRTVQHITFNPVVIAAVEKQNTENLSLETIKQRDEEWSATEKLTPFKRSLQVSKAGRTLQRLVNSNDEINEAFLTDNQGANVAAYPATSDYWQGDEEKWTASFNGGTGKIFIGDMEQDASTNTAAVQISAPVLDRGQTIGVLVVGVTLDYVQARQGDN